ncbi:MAG: hypothetical protein ACR2K6_08840 [Solirubrobacterales bacterium]
MDAKLKHLDYIQTVIGRMATNSFLFKGWAMTIATGLSAFGAADTKVALLVIAIITTALFWGLDGYYLWLERGFIALHNSVAAKDEGQIDFCMAIDKSDAVKRWLRTCLRPHLLAFYGLIMVVEAIGIAVLREGM